MSDLQVAVLPLDKGLDLSSAKLVAPPGSLLSCLNYEITDTMGLSRIYGFEPYDAQHSPSITALYRVILDDTPDVVVGDIITIDQAVISTEVVDTARLLTEASEFIMCENGDNLAWGDATVTAATSAIAGLDRTIVVGKVVALDLSSNAFWMLVSNADLLNPQAELSKLDLTTATTTPLDPTVNLILGSDYYSDEDDYYQALLDAFTSLRDDITELGYPAAGLHYFRDTSYAVAPVRQFVIKAVDGSNVEVAGDWTHTMAAGGWIGNGTNSAKAWIVDITSSTDGSGFERAYVNVVEDYEDWDEAIAANSTLSGTGFAAGGAVGATKLIIHDTQLATDCLVGTLWKCRSVQQDLDDAVVPIAPGWHHINQGFTVGFENGNDTDGVLTKLERSADAIPASATYYLTDGVNVISCDLVSYFIDPDTGDITAGTGQGVLQIRNLVATSGSLVPIDNTFDIHTATPPAGGNKLADLTDTFAYNSLELNPILAQENTRYEFVTANFYANADWDAFYGVNGIGRAFYYTADGLFAHIYTQLDEDKDNPRHVEYHHNHLALGFRQGSVMTSVAGEPHNFLAEEGAQEHGVGDRVTGLQSLSGDVLGVFCEASIRGIAGTAVDNFTQQVIAPKTGCIEYTLVNMGEPVYCNSAGIVTLSQSEKYGNFVGQPLSYDVNSWLRPRLNRISGRFSPQAAVVAAMPVRAKNQYRLFFRDGKVLTMTVIPDGGAKFTTQELLLDDEIIVPFAISSETDENGEELLHFSFYNPKTGDYSNNVFELDKGWGFSGEPISHEFETNWFSGQNPAQYFGVQKVRMHGITRGRASILVAASGTQNQYGDAYHETEQWIDLPRTPVFFSDEGQPVSASTDLANRGMAIQLKFTNRTLTTPEPSHICQVLVLQSRPGTKQDA